MIRSIYLCYICKYSTYAGKINIFHFQQLLKNLITYLEKDLVQCELFVFLVLLSTFLRTQSKVCVTTPYQLIGHIERQQREEAIEFTLIGSFKGPSYSPSSRISLVFLKVESVDEEEERTFWKKLFPNCNSFSSSLKKTSLPARLSSMSKLYTNLVTPTCVLQSHTYRSLIIQVNQKILS